MLSEALPKRWTMAQRLTPATHQCVALTKPLSGRQQAENDGGCGPTDGKTPQNTHKTSVANAFLVQVQ